MSWKSYKLGELLERKRVKADIKPNQEYKLVTIRLWHQGVVLREEKIGEDIKSNMYHVNTGDFVLSGIDARNGAFGIVPKELEGAVVTNDFWCLEPKKDLLRKDFFLFITSTTFFDYICKQCSDGTTQRIRLQKDKFNDFEIALPPIEEQGDLVNALIKSKKSNEDLSIELTHQLDLVKQLRQAFLREAMQGKLVPQDPNVESASMLLANIKAEKERLIKEGKIKKSKSLPPISEDEVPFGVPENWVWCRLGDITNSVSTGPFGTMLHKSDYVKDGIPLVNPMNIIDGKIVASNKMMVDEKTRQRLKSYILKTGDVVIGRRGEMGRCAAVSENEDGWLCGTGSFFIDLHISIHRPFFIRVLNSDTSKQILLGDSVGSTMNNLNHRILSNLPIPLPPLSEQQRIVAKLDELMQYCDELEASIKASQQQNELLLQQVLREALEPSYATALR